MGQALLGHQFPVHTTGGAGREQLVRATRTPLLYPGAPTGHACSARVPADPAAAEQLGDRAAVAVPDFLRQGIQMVRPECLVTVA